MKSPIIKKRSVVIAGRKTSIALEDDFWRAFREIASARALKLTELINGIAAAHPDNLSSAVRLFVLNHYRDLISKAAASQSGRRAPPPHPSPD